MRIVCQKNLKMVVIFWKKTVFFSFGFARFVHSAKEKQLFLPPNK